MAGYYEAAANFDEDPEPLRALIESSANLGRSDRDGLTLLHYACREGHLDAALMLVEAGVALEAQDRDARTPLHLACLMAGKQMTRGSRHVEITRYLVQEGASTGTQDRWNRVPLAYLPQSAKRLGINTPAVYEPTAVWAVEEVTRDGVVLEGSVAQSSVVHLLRN